MRQISRRTGSSRNTVRRYLRDAEAARYGPRALRVCKLDAYVDYLAERLAQARPDWIPATVLLREIREQGYAGGISQLKAHLAPFKQAAIDPVVRFETAPGRQMQVDFTTVRRGRDRLLAFVATMGYSRASFVHFTQREDFARWRDGLLGAFEYFGGVTRGGAVRQRQARGHRARPVRPGLASMAPGHAGSGAELRLPVAAVPPVSCAHQGQGRALQRLPEGQLPGAARRDPACGCV